MHADDVSRAEMAPIAVVVVPAMHEDDCLATRVCLRCTTAAVRGDIASGPRCRPRIIAAMASLSRADVEHVAHLARLGLTHDELARLEGQLNHILEQFAKLAELDTDAIPPTAQVIELENILRDDVARSSLPVEVVMANAPERDGDFFVVPAILGGE